MRQLVPIWTLSFIFSVSSLVTLPRSALCQEAPQSDGAKPGQRQQEFVGVSSKRSYNEALADALSKMDKAVADEKIPCNDVSWRVIQIGGRSGTPADLQTLEVRISAIFQTQGDRGDAVANPSGVWTVTRTAGEDKLEGFKLTLKLEKDKLSGFVTWPNKEETSIAGGQFKEGIVSFKIKRGDFIQDYSGKLEQDRILGKWAAGIAAFDWEAQREPKRVPFDLEELHGQWHFEHGALGEFDRLQLNGDGTFELEHRDVALGDTITYGKWSTLTDQLVLRADRQEHDGEPVTKFKTEQTVEVRRANGDLALGTENREFRRSRRP